jgi:hypothetical protein
MNRRRMPLVLTLAAVIVVASLYWCLSPSRSSQAAPAPSSDDAFRKKVLLVHTSSMMSAFILEKAQIRKIGDQFWLVGTGAADGRTHGWNKGRNVSLSMDHIDSITEFDQLADAKKALESGGGMPFGGHGMPIPAEGAEETSPPGIPVPGSRPQLPKEP